jgi:hypothetical protein
MLDAHIGDSRDAAEIRFQAGQRFIFHTLPIPLVSTNSCQMSRDLSVSAKRRAGSIMAGRIHPQGIVEL